MSTLLETFSKDVDTYNQTVETLTQKMVEQLRPALKELVNSSSGVTQIEWSQYTPYFNDGDPCQFSVNTPTISTKDGELCVYELKYQTEGRWPNQTRIFAEEDRETGNLIESIENFIRSIPEDVMLAAFDDHQQITVTVDEITTTEYDHD